MTKPRSIKAPEVPTVETEVQAPPTQLARHERLIIFGDEDDAAEFDRWWDELGRTDYMGTVQRKREWDAQQRRKRPPREEKD
jgi:hypothetical protein